MVFTLLSENIILKREYPPANIVNCYHTEWDKCDKWHWQGHNSCYSLAFFISSPPRPLNHRASWSYTEKTNTFMIIHVMSLQLKQ